MEHLKKIRFLSEAIGKSVSSEENRGIFGITTCGGIVYSWNIAGLHAADFLTLEVAWKAIAGIFTIFIAPPLGVFMKDVYIEKVRPKIFKKKRR